MATTPDYYAKVGETFSPSGVLIGKDNTPQNLTLATAITLSLRPRGGGTAVFSNAACSFTANTTGAFSFSSPSVLAVPVGLYEMDITVTFTGGVTHKFPSGGPNTGNEFMLVKVSASAS